jgi:hypothetical protein
MIPQLTHSGRRVVGQGGQSEPLHGRPGRQDPLRQGHTVRDPGTLRGRAAAGDRDPAGPDRTAIGGPLSQLCRADQPVSPCRLAESFSRTEMGAAPLE